MIYLLAIIICTAKIINKVVTNMLLPVKRCKKPQKLPLNGTTWKKVTHRRNTIESFFVFLQAKCNVV